MPCGATLMFSLGHGSAIVILHISSGPPTVLRRVVAIIVDPVEAVHGRPWTHVSKKVLKAIPSIAHLNSAPTPVRPPRMVGIEAPLPHQLPDLMRPPKARVARTPKARQGPR